MKRFNADEVRERIAALIAKGDAVLMTRTQPGRSISGRVYVAPRPFVEWQAQSAALLRSLLGSDHTYVETFASVAKGPHATDVNSGLGILRAVAEDVELGLLGSIRDLVTAEVFTDFLDMASHLNEAGYHVAAASLGGAVLEDGLRRIAAKNAVKVGAQDDLATLNKKCADAKIYTRLVQKRLQVWIDVRNLADHGRFNDVKADDVSDLVNGTTSFLAEHL